LSEEYQEILKELRKVRHFMHVMAKAQKDFLRLMQVERTKREAEYRV